MALLHTTVNCSGERTKRCDALLRLEINVLNAGVLSAANALAPLQLRDWQVKRAIKAELYKSVVQLECPPHRHRTFESDRVGRSSWITVLQSRGSEQGWMFLVVGGSKDRKGGPTWLIVGLGITLR